MKKALSHSGLMAVVAVVTIPAHAQLINAFTEVDGTSTDGGSQITTSPNLVNSATLSSQGFSGFDDGTGISNIASLKDGSIGGTGSSTTSLDPGGSSPSGSLLGDPWTLTVALDTSSASLGYDLTNIKVVSTWGGRFSQYSSAWVSQNYELFYSTVAEPTTYIDLGSYTGLVQESSGEHILQTSLTNLDGTAFASGVANLKFSFTPIDSGFQGGGGGNAISEIEAFGTPTATVPEPSTYAMLALGMGVLVIAARRRGHLQ